jgi:ATP-dependent DNA helicase PIF1
LNSIANGTFGEDLWNTLKYHTFDTTLHDQTDHFQDAVKLCARNHDSKTYNIQKIKDMHMPIAPIKAENSSSKARKAPANKAGGLHNSIIICKDSKVMLLQNLWNHHGLTNGANGFVRYIIYKEGVQPPKLPSFVLVYFPQYTGPSFHPTEEKLVPIVPVLRNWFESRTEHHRTMLPLIPSCAITIHKSQGQTLDKIILNLGGREICFRPYIHSIKSCYQITKHQV